MARNEVVIPIGSKKYRPFLALGLGIAAKYGVGRKAALLDLAVRHKIAVPSAIILLDTAYQDALADGLLRIDGVNEARKVSAPIPHKLVTAYNLPNFNWEFPGPFAIRAAFSNEGAPDESLADRFAARLAVDPKDGDALALAFCEVWTSALAMGGEERLRRDLLIMHMVESKLTGTATVAHESTDDAVVIAGSEPSEPLRLPHNARGLRLDAWQTRLQRLLREVRRHFVHRRVVTNWQVDWIDDGQTCWLVRLMPLEPSKY